VHNSDSFIGKLIKVLISYVSVEAANKTYTSAGHVAERFTAKFVPDNETVRVSPASRSRDGQSGAEKGYNRAELHFERIVSSKWNLKNRKYVCGVLGG
jgi:hypothetical protein